MGVPVLEKALTKDIERVHRYNQLKGLSHFLVRNSGAREGSYTLAELKEEMKPFTDYYQDFNLRAQALDYYELHLNATHDNQKNLQDFQNSLTDAQR
jgi:hypothetical protein